MQMSVEKLQQSAYNGFQGDTTELLGLISDVYFSCSVFVCDAFKHVHVAEEKKSVRRLVSTFCVCLLCVRVCMKRDMRDEVSTFCFDV